MKVKINVPRKDLRREVFRAGGPGGQEDGIVDLEGEEWRDVPGYEGHYEISSHARVASLKHGKRRLLKAQQDKHGYWHVVLSVNNKLKTWKTCYLVSAAFLGPKPAGLCVRHLDDDKNNNHVGNLAYGTVGENMADCIRNGHLRPPKGSTNGMSRLSEDQVRQIVSRVGAGEDWREIYGDYGISRRQMRDIAAGVAWKHIPRPKGDDPAEAN